MRVLDFDRRFTIISALSAASLAGCRAGSPPMASGPASLDTRRLAEGFADLANLAKPGALGLGVALISPALAWVSDANARFPMQSVFKAFLAAAALSRVDAGQWKLAEPVSVTAADLAPGESPITRSWTGRPMILPLADLIALAIQRSDNTAADVLMKRLGGPSAVTAWLRGKAIADISVDRYETEIQPEVLGMGPFQPAWVDPRVWGAVRDAVPAAAREAATANYLADARDTASLAATLDFLTRLANVQLLSSPSTRLLMRLMTDSATGEHRLKAGLPPGASLAHKTGSSATDLGLTPAWNDIGVVTLANGRKFAVAAFLTGSSATQSARDTLIADAAHLAASCVS